jgi:phage terminase small subunit
MVKSTGVPPLLQTDEPDWTCVFADDLEIAFARKHWRIYLAAMRDMGTISEENVPSLVRLITIEVLWDRSMKQVAEHGAVIPPKRKNSRAISRLNPHFAALKGLSSELLALESELGLSPRARSKVSPARRKATQKLIGGGYLKVVK